MNYWRICGLSSTTFDSISYKDLWELRIKSGRSQFRIMYFLYSKNIFVLVSAFCKKRNKTPRNELEIAKNRMIDYINRG